MPRTPAPTVHEEFPSADYFQALITRFETFPDDPIAQALAKTCVKAVEIERKEVKSILKNELVQSDHRPLGLSDMESRLRSSSGLLERVLVRAGFGDAVAKTKKDYSALVPRTEQLLKLGADSKKDSLRAMRKETEQDLAQYTEAESRVRKGGHPLFDDHATNVARKLWVTLDNAYDGLAICLRSAGITSDPVLAARPTVKSPLRPVLNAKSKPKHHATKTKKGTGKGGDPGAPGKSGDPASPMKLVEKNGKGSGAAPAASDAGSGSSVESKATVT